MAETLVATPDPGAAADVITITVTTRSGASTRTVTVNQTIDELTRRGLAEAWSLVIEDLYRELFRPTPRFSP